MGLPSAQPAAMPAAAPPAPDAADQAVRSARLMERRRQLGFQGRMSTFLTDYRGQLGPTPSGGRSLLGE